VAVNKIALRFVEGGGWDSKLIRWDTRCQWSHVEFFDEARHQTLGAMLKGGCKYRDLSDPVYKHVVSTTFKHISCTPQQYELFYDFLQSQIGKPYDWRAILSFGLGNRDWREEDSWFCSEWQLRALEVASILTLPPDIIQVSRLTPRDAWVLSAFCKS
jgi:hypothetical protein